MSTSDRIIITVISLIIIAAVACGFYINGSPFSAANQKIDNLRLSYFGSLRSSIQSYAYTNHALPQNLSEITPSVLRVAKDPGSGAAFDYAITTSSSFHLCTTFADDSGNEQSGNETYYPYGAGATTHKKGYDCITYTVTIPVVPSSTSSTVPIEPPAPFE
jgi:hypothetical protein